MKRCAFAFVVLTALAYGQAWSGILATTRAIDWSSAGLPGTFPDGETTPNPWTPPTGTRASCGTISTLTGISTAMATCHTNHATGGVLTLVAGTYTLTNTNLQYLVTHNNVTLKGQGAATTKIILAGSSQIQMGLGSSTAGGSIGAKLTGSPAAGATSFTINTVTGSPMFGVGNLITIIQCNTGQSGTPNPSGGGCAGTQTDNGGLYQCGNSSICNIDGAGTGASPGQTLLVTGLSNLGGGSWTVNFSPGLYMSNWSTSRSVGIFWNDPAFSPVGVGLEDVTIETQSTATAGVSLSVTTCYACWVKGVRFVGKGAGGSTQVDLGSPAGGGPKNFLYSNFYQFADNPTALSSDNTLAMIYSTTSDDLILNGEIEDGFIEGQGVNSGVVIAYVDVHNSQGSGGSFYQASQFQHHPNPNFTLLEGNQMMIREDDTWGTHLLNTFFRNYSPCYDPPFTGGVNGQTGLQFDAFARFENAVGNAIGDGNAAGCTVFSSNSGGAAFEINFGNGTVSDPLVATTLMRWGNVTTFSQVSDTPTNSGIRFVSSEVPSSLSAPNVALSNAVPGSTTLPASFFMSATAHPNGGTGLSWWKTCTSWTTFPTSCAAYTTQPFPTNGPDVSGGLYTNGHAYDTPARLAFKNLPVDTTYQNSLTVTGSSWAGGTETLTVSGLPGGPHVMGGFTPPAWNSACNPASGSSFTGRSDGEILITDSNGTTTMAYALAGNPGVSCTGTIKWPNVRKFDSAVFTTDSSTNSKPAPSGSFFAGNIKTSGQLDTE